MSASYAVPGSEAVPADRTGFTSRWTILLAVLAALAVTGLRASTTADLVRDRLPADVSAQIGDPRLEQLAVQVAVLLGALLTAVALGVLLLVARSLERHLLPGTVAWGRLRIGLFAGVVTLGFLGLQVQGVLAGDQIPSRGARIALVVVLSLIAVGLGRRRLRGLGAGRTAGVVAAVLALALLMTVG